MALKLLVGLGNPEPRYELTRHNAGFKTIEKVATKYGGNLAFQSKMHAETGKVKMANCDVMLARPMTYMNLSGKAVAAITNFYKIDKSDILIIHDEVALPMGVLRLARGGGGSAGNHGIESIMECLGHKDFQRLRIGVGPDPGGATRGDFVLSVIKDGDLDLYYKSIDLAIEASEAILREGIQAAMNKFNGIDLREP